MRRQGRSCEGHGSRGGIGTGVSSSIINGIGDAGGRRTERIPQPRRSEIQIQVRFEGRAEVVCVHGPHAAGAGKSDGGGVSVDVERAAASVRKIRGGAAEKLARPAALSSGRGGVVCANCVGGGSLRRVFGVVGVDLAPMVGEERSYGVGQSVMVGHAAR